MGYAEQMLHEIRMYIASSCTCDVEIAEFIKTSAADMIQHDAIIDADCIKIAEDDIHVAYIINP